MVLEENPLTFLRLRSILVSSWSVSVRDGKKRLKIASKLTLPRISPGRLPLRGGEGLWLK